MFKKNILCATQHEIVTSCSFYLLITKCSNCLLKEKNCHLFDIITSFLLNAIIVFGKASPVVTYSVGNWGGGGSLTPTNEAGKILSSYNVHCNKRLIFDVLCYWTYFTFSICQ